MAPQSACCERGNCYKVMEVFLNFCAKTIGKKFAPCSLKETILLVINIPFELKNKVTEQYLY